MNNTSGQSLNISSSVVSPSSLPTQTPERNVDTRKSLTFSNHHRTENIGIVKGVPKQAPPLENKAENQTQNKVNEEKYYVSPSNLSKVCFVVKVKSNRKNVTFYFCFLFVVNQIQY